MTVREHFETLCTVPHCSKQAAAMLEYLRAAAESFGYRVESDAAGNLLCTHPNASVTLQAHYDMVCIGNAPELALRAEAGWLSAETSTLGADNGMGMAIMLAMMEEGRAVDALFTADEEVGLLGARALALPLKTPYLLNLDSETFGEITIGCAGGVDITVTLPLDTRQETLPCYETVEEGYPGGHSGVDIDKAIPNAIKELAARLYEMQGARLVRFEGGERRNTIAKRARAVVAIPGKNAPEGFKPLGEQPCLVIENDVLRMLHGFAHGVREWNATLGIVQSSVNLALVGMEEDVLHVTLSARSMSSAGLRRLESEIVAYFERFGAKVQSEGFYPPWEPDQNTFVSWVKALYEEIAGTPVTVGAIHAGLECGIIREKSGPMQMASIGPTILYPHSTRECVDLRTIDVLCDVVRAVIAQSASERAVS